MGLLRLTKIRLRIVGALVVGSAVFLASCGTLLYPERRGQPAGRLDVGVVLLDGIGLLLFLVPGVIAFVVDFATGAIYLPPDHSHGGPLFGMELRKVPVAPGELTPQRVETIVREQTGKTVNLQPGEYRAMKLDNLNEVTPEALEGLQANPATTEVIFRAKSE